MSFVYCYFETALSVYPANAMKINMDQNSDSLKNMRPFPKILNFVGFFIGQDYLSNIPVKTYF